MSDLTDPDELQPLVRTCQIIVGALIMGVVSFFLIVVLLVPGGMAMAPAPVGGAPAPAAAGPGTPLFTYLAVAFGLINLGLSFVVPNLALANGRRQIARGVAPKLKGGPTEAKQIYPSGDTGMLAQLYQTQLIVGAAMLEGAAFFAGIAYMLERSPIALGMALVLLVVLAARFPMADRVQAWLDQQLGLLQEERQSAL